MDEANSSDRAQSETGCAAPTMVATAVPQDPAPITATRSLMPPETTAASPSRRAPPVHWPRVEGDRPGGRDCDAPRRRRARAPRGPDPSQGIRPGQAAVGVDPATPRAGQ